MTDMVDWELAVRLGARLAGDGPQVSPAEAASTVAQLRVDADRSRDLVREFTGLDAPPNGAPLLVVDRAGWVRANADAFAGVIAPLTDKLEAARTLPGTSAIRAVGSRVTGTEVGLLLGFLGSKVLGQFDPMYADTGRLLLVAPNIVHTEQQINADPDDFRLWVCLHEETHRVQFTSVPWLRDHLLAQVGDLVDAVDPGSALDVGFARALEALREGTKGMSILEMVSSPEQRRVIDRITGMMSLLEGHADVVMDGVGPGVIPSVASIRKAFTRRRQGVGTLDRILRRLLGLDAKMAQYRDGATFVRAVVDEVGMDRFNSVWAAPDHLPDLAEIHEPRAWMDRVL
ncbi:zinc-dependent metalloprotease [Nocardioides limicola]|uniref:zinc-dependent metalloprotease n=1 Tax=Nocardioides limicola TaxID=2803368 RepID=UPI0027DE918B|nr:zinc-dependent metalloprotease [Nocardioides sp. DJM-14]